MDVGTVQGALVMRDLATAVITKVEGALAEFGSALDKTAKSADKASTAFDAALGKKLKDSGKALTDFGKKASLSLTLPLATAATGAVVMAKNFEQSMTKIETLAGVAGDQVENWKDAVMSMSGEIGRPPQELADALFAVASAGERGGAALEILRESGMSASIGLGETETISRALVSTMAAYKQSGLSAAEANRVLIATVQEGNLEATELAGTLGRVVGIAATAGVSFAQVGGFLATFTRLGVDSAEAVTALRGILGTIIKPSNQAREQLQRLGMSVDGLREAVREKGLAVAMNDLANATRGNLDAIGEIIPNVRALSGFLGTAGVNGKAFADVTNTITAAQKDASFTTSRFQRTTETFAHVWESFTTRIKVTATTIGKELIPVLTNAVDRMKPIQEALIGLAKGFSALPGTVQSAAMGALVLAAALGPLSYLFGNVKKIIGAVVGSAGLGALIKGFMETIRLARVMGATPALLLWLRNLMAVIPGATTAVTAIGAALGALAGPVLAVAAALGAVVLAIRYFTGSWSATGKVIVNLVDQFGILRGALNFVVSMFSGVVPVIAKVWQVFNDLYTIVAHSVGPVLSDVGDWFSRAADRAKPLYEWVGKLRNYVMNLGESLATRVKEGLAIFVAQLSLAHPWVMKIVGAVAWATGEFSDFAQSVHEQAEGWREYDRRTEGVSNALAAFPGPTRAATAAITAASKAAKEGKVWTTEYGRAVDWTGGVLNAASGEWAALYDPLNRTKKEFVLSAAAVGTAADAVGAAAPPLKNLSEELGEAQRMLSKLSGAQRAQIKAGIDLGYGTSDIVARFNEQNKTMQITSGVVDLYKNKLSEAEKAQKATEKSLDSLKDAIAEFSGAKAYADADALASAILLTGGAANKTQAQLQDAKAKLDALFDSVKGKGGEVEQRFKDAAAAVNAALQQVGSKNLLEAPIKALDALSVEFVGVESVAKVSRSTLEGWASTLDAAFEQSIRDGSKIPPVFYAMNAAITAQLKVLDQQAAKQAAVKAGQQATIDIMKQVSAATKEAQAIQTATANTATIARLPEAWREVGRAMLDYRDRLKDVKDGTQQADAVLKDMASRGVVLTQALIDQVLALAPAMDSSAQSMRAALLAQLQQMLADAGMTAEQIAEIWSKIGMQGPAPKPADAPKKGFWESVFGTSKDAGAGLAGSILDAIKGGGDTFAAAGGWAGSKIFGGISDKVTKWAGTLKGTAGKLGNMLGGAIGAAGPLLGDAFAKMSKSANKAISSLGSAASGAMAGFSVGGPIGAAIGGIAGALKGIFGGGQAKATKKMRNEWIDSAGGLEKVAEMAKYAGFNTDKLLKTKKTKEFEAEVKKLEAAYKAVQERVQKLGEDLTTTMSSGAVISRSLWSRLLADKDKAEIKKALESVLNDSVARAAAGFNRIATNLFKTLPTDQMRKLLEGWGKDTKYWPDVVKPVVKQIERLGVLAGAAFGALIASGKTAVEAITEIGPGLDEIANYLKQTGTDATGTIGQLLGFRSVIDQHKELFEVLGGVDDMLIGLQNAGLMTQQTFSALASLVTDSFTELTATGTSADDAMRLMQPQLQRLWELSTEWNYALTEGEQALVDQAIASGIVGDKFKSAQERMVDAVNTLVDRFDILLKSLGLLPDAATSAARQIEGAFSGVNVPPIKVPYYTEDQGGSGIVPTPPPMAAGGVVRRPLTALIGEAGPEAVIPLDRLESWINAPAASTVAASEAVGGDDGGYMPVTLQVDGETFARVIAKVVKRRGLR